MGNREIYSNFFVLFGEIMYNDKIYEQCKKSDGNRKTPTDITQIVAARLGSGISAIIGQFFRMREDYNAGKLPEEDYERFLRYINLLICDSIEPAKRLNNEPEIVAAVKNFASKRLK